jgi:hypothetical protein
MLTQFEEYLGEHGKISIVGNSDDVNSHDVKDSAATRKSFCSGIENFLA